jgi:hypothetical protein
VLSLSVRSAVGRSDYSSTITIDLPACMQACLDRPWSLRIAAKLTSWWLNTLLTSTAHVLFCTLNGAPSGLQRPLLATATVARRGADAGPLDVSDKHSRCRARVTSFQHAYASAEPHCWLNHSCGHKVQEALELLRWRLRSHNETCTQRVG